MNRVFFMLTKTLKDKFVLKDLENHDTPKGWVCRQIITSFLKESIWSIFNKKLDCKSANQQKILILLGQKLCNNDYNKVHSTQYQRFAGKLICVTDTKPNISCVVGSPIIQNTKQSQWEAILKILNYLNGAQGKEFGHLKMKSYSNVEYATTLKIGDPRQPSHLKQKSKSSNYLRYVVIVLNG